MAAVPLSSRLRRVVGRALGGSLAVAAGLGVVLMVEVQMARSGHRLPERPLVLDRAGAGPRMVWLGDSTAAGEGASSPSGAVASQVQDGIGIPGAALKVLAVSGARAADVLVHQVPSVAAERPDLVLISVGANDTVHLTGAGDFRRTYDRPGAGIAPGVPVVLLGVPDMGAITRFAQPLRAIAGRRGRHLDAEVRRVAADTGAIYAPIAGPTGPAFRHDPRRYLSADDFHPSSDGYGLWADAVLRVLRREGLPRI